MVLYIKASKKLECGCVFYACIRYSHYECISSIRCKTCIGKQLQNNEDILAEEFNINLPFPNEKDYSKLNPLGWIIIESLADENTIFNDDYDDHNE
jgi:hypothetical protein